MDNEMKAKVEEFVKTNGRQELSLDEMDKVSGGAGISMETHEDIDAYCAVVDVILRQFGEDVAIAYVRKDIESDDVDVCIKSKGAAGLGAMLHNKLNSSAFGLKWGGAL